MWNVVIFSNQKITTRNINSKEDAMGRDSGTVPHIWEMGNVLKMYE
jgi:hypothetical protein